MEETSRLPEGMEWLIEAWPKFEDDAPVKLGDMALIDGYADMVEAVQIWIHGKPVIYGDNGSQQLEKGERVKRPEILAADGEPLEVGQTVYLPDGTLLHVTGIGDMTEGHQTVFGKAGNDIIDDEWDAVLLTHQCPVLDADGVPIREGDTVYEVEGTGHAYKVVGIRVGDGDPLTPTVVTCDEGDGTSEHFLPSQLTHAKHAIDSWKRIEEDLGDEMAKQQCGPISPELACRRAGELVRRCKALAERERGE